jgi:CBS domain containing-hemolysin-like protein
MNAPNSPPARSAESKAAPQRPADTWRERLKSLLGLRPASLRTDLAEELAEGEGGKTEFTPAERTMLRNILGLRERRIGDIMVPRADIVAVHKDIPIGELLKVFAGAGHSRLVVYDDTLDDPVGLVHIRDLVAYLTEQAAVDPEKNARRRKPLPADLDPRALDLTEPLSSTNIMRRILFAPPSMPAIDLLVKMQTTRIHLALVIDEYGGSDGLVSIEDIVEEIVGEIEDEHDDEDLHIITLSDGSFIADARASLDEARHKISPAFSMSEANEEVDTLGGLLVMLAGRVPVRGEIIAGPGNFEIEVLDADPRRVKRLRIYRRPPASPAREPRRRKVEEEASVAPSLPTAPLVGATRPAGPGDESSS